jgi:soluble lytic murein transglycosylase
MLRSWEMDSRVDFFVSLLRFIIFCTVMMVAGSGYVSSMAWAAQIAGKKTSAKSKTTAKSKSKSSRRFSAAEIRRLQSMKKTFVASADLKAMAQQLLQARTPQAYAGVEAYAAKHKDDEAGPLAWLALGYAHSLDSDYPKALAAWRETQPLAPLLGDALDYLRASAYQGQKDPA